MQAVLIFNLPEDKQDFEVASKGMDYALCWDNLSEQIRQKLKYGELSDEANEALEGIRAPMFELASDRGLPELY